MSYKAEAQPSRNLLSKKRRMTIMHNAEKWGSFHFSPFPLKFFPGYGLTLMIELCEKKNWTQPGTIWKRPGHAKGLAALSLPREK